MMLGRGQCYPEGYRPFARYVGFGVRSTPSTIEAPDGSLCWWLPTTLDWAVESADADVCDVYSTLTRHLPLWQRLLTVRTEWSRK